MAEITTILQEFFDKLMQKIEGGAITTEEATRRFNDYGKSIGAATEKLSPFIVKIKEANDDLREFVNLKLSDEFHKWLEKGQKSFEGFKGTLGDGSLSAGQFAEKVGSLALALSSNKFANTLFGGVPQQFSVMGESAKVLQAQLANLPGVAALGEKGRKWLELADAGRNMERGMLMSAAATGQLSNMFDNMGRGLKNLPNAVAMFNQQTQQIGDITGQSSAQVAMMYREFLRIPGVLTEVDKQTTIAGQGMHLLTAEFALASGTGQTNEQVMKETSFAVQNLGLSAEKSLMFIAEMRDASEKTGIPLEKMTDLAQNAAGAFALWGDNTAGTISMIEKLGPGLRNAGATLEQTQRILGDTTNAMAKMTTAQRAFLSSQTGGPGGLQGAFEIELLLKQGKSAEVMSKLKENMMQKLGGPLVTLEQAAGGGEAAMQFQKQRAFMMSPAMGGMAKDERSADMLLEAMAKGGEMPKLEDAMVRGNENLKTAIDQGTQIQKRMRDESIKASNFLQAIVASNAQAAAQYQRMAIGEGNTVVANRFDNEEKEAATNTRFNPLTGNVVSAHAARIAGPNFAYDQAKNGGLEMLENVKSGIGSLAGGYGDLKKSMGLKKDAFADAKSPEGKGGSAFPDIANQSSNAFGNIGNFGVEGQIINPNTRVARELDTYQKSKGQAMFGSDSQASPKQQDVFVTTVCSVCTKKIATSEAQKAVDMAFHKEHQQNKDSLYHPQ